MARRSKLEMCLDILGIIGGGTSKPTCIMYGANVSWEILQQTLAAMVSRGLVREIDARDARRRDRRTKTRYEITQKGEDIIRHFRRARGLVQLEEASAARR
ncbi:hypothetical protein AC482_05450 [miscellaneous Crenarchaeota group-15 archaeon DG-45]|uniref:ArnR1-like winged helix-turn-helix domain-containing protein n=1 Tax=miscellaneous Crenarchaeota group-15 archaeon DG-45 TaxID=1685127 RepID=A0A0M0BN11_9ARCH|nr:MAG: hypothetical protein AC482_05450 [miscellaneous Crenarchaeota group-15 archaeon DG-45]